MACVHRCGGELRWQSESPAHMGVNCARNNETQRAKESINASAAFPSYGRAGQAKGAKTRISRRCPNTGEQWNPLADGRPGAALAGACYKQRLWERHDDICQRNGQEVLVVPRGSKRYRLAPSALPAHAN